MVSASFRRAVGGGFRRIWMQAVGTGWNPATHLNTSPVQQAASSHQHGRLPVWVPGIERCFRPRIHAKTAIIPAYPPGIAFRTEWSWRTPCFVSHDICIAGSPTGPGSRGTRGSGRSFFPGRPESESTADARNRVRSGVSGAGDLYYGRHRGHRCLHPPRVWYTSAGWFVERGTYLTLVKQVRIALSKSSSHPTRLVCQPLSLATLKEKSGSFTPSIGDYGGQETVYWKPQLRRKQF